MGNPYPADFLEPDGSVRLGGAITFTDQANQPGGGSQPITRELLSGTAVSIASGDTTPLTFNTHVQGDTLLDISTPALPTVITTGTYAFSFFIQPTSGLPAGKTFDIACDFDLANEDAGGVMTSPPATAEQVNPAANLSLTYYLIAGAQVRIQVMNNTAGTESFAIAGVVVQRLA